MGADTEPTKTTKIADEIARVPSKLFQPGALSALVLLGCGAFGAVIGTSWAADAVDARAEKKVTPIVQAAEKRVTNTLDEHAKLEAEKIESMRAEFREQLSEVKAQNAQKDERDGKRFEIMLQTFMTGRMQPGAAALSKPVDGGP